MQVPIPKRPVQTTLERLIVGAPASAANARDWISGLAHLIGYVTTPVTSQTFKLSASTAQTHFVAYKRRPGVVLLRITVETAAGTADAARGKLAVTVIDSAGAAVTAPWLGGSHVMDGTLAMPCINQTLRNYPTADAWLDVSGLTAGAWHDLVFTWTNVSASRGLAVVHVHECPLASSDPLSASTEPGADLTWARARQGIVDGTSSGTRGMQRLLGQMDIARAQCPKQGVQLCTSEDTTNAWATTATVAGTAVAFGTASDPLFRVRARSLYGTSVANNWALRLRYKCSDALAWNPTFRVAVTPVGGATTNYDFTLANQTTFAAKTTDNAAATMALTLPSSGTGQVCTIRFRAWNSAAAKTTYVSQIALVENES